MEEPLNVFIPFNKSVFLKSVILGVVYAACHRLQHLGKNVFDSIISHLLYIKGKMKDSIKSQIILVN